MTNQKHTEELFPCPFCSGQGRLQSKMREGYEDHALDQDAYAYYVRCISCACDGPWFKNEGSAIRSWNQRPQITAITKQRDELREALETAKNWLYRNRKYSHQNQGVCVTEENKSCECLMWTRVPKKFITDHHENCEHYSKEVETKARRHLTTLIKHFSEFCNEGDGIPIEYWEDYKQALLFVGDVHRYTKCVEWDKKNADET